MKKDKNSTDKISCMLLPKFLDRLLRQESLENCQETIKKV